MNIQSQPQVDEVLNSFGLNPDELKIYKELLSSGTRPAGTIATRVGLKRGRTYNVLQNLIEQGIVQEFLKSGVRQFSCSPLTSLLTIIDQRSDELNRTKKGLEEILPILSQMQSPNSTESKLRFFRGTEGIKEIYEDMLRTPDTIIYALLDIQYNTTFTKGDDFRWINNFIKKRRERNIWWYGIMNESEETDTALGSRRSFNRKVKKVENLYLPIGIEVYGHKIAITSTHGEKVGFLLENENVADALRGIHQTAWELLPDYTVQTEREEVCGRVIEAPPEEEINGLLSN